MSLRLWNNVALTAALMVWGLSAHAQATGVAGGQGAVPQVRPAPVTGRVATDPAAVALRPAAQAPLTSTARQVPPPANLNEPLLKPEAEQVKAVSSSARHEPRASVAAQDPTTPATTPTRPHVDRTHGVKKTSETQPRPHERKTKGKPHHAGQKASSAAPKDGRHPGGKGAKRGGATHGQHAATSATPQVKMAGSPAKRLAARAEGHGTRTPEKRTAAHAHQTGKLAHVKQPGSATKAPHAHAAAPASAPVAKKPVRHKHPHA
ncbi:MAG: hypothetical protein HYX44_08005 [Aquabacterium sp.]|nr:hypothetical protein [Aquabacterium sp.]